jgi:hypothetical protein
MDNIFDIKVILYYISLILLILLIVLITVYITKVNTNGYMTCEKIREIENSQALGKQLNNVYELKVSKEFEKMFSQNSTTAGYEVIIDDLNKKYYKNI